MARQKRSAPARSRPARRQRPAPPAQAGSASAAGGWTPAAGEVGLRVRMYRVGFGDFFLLSVLDDQDMAHHVIVDCGVFRGTSQRGDIGSIEACVADMVQTTGGRVALVIMTHRHADHIAGFARCAERFRTLTVGGVWMPIWESDYEPAAAKFQGELTRTALALRRHLTALGASTTEEQVTARQYMENATGDLGMAGAAATGSNAAALDLLKHGFAGVTPGYYAIDSRAELPQALVDAGVSARILGPPPLTDTDFMKLMDLQKGVGQYLAGAGHGDDAERFAPFDPEFELRGGEVAGTGGGYLPDSFREFAHPRTSWQTVTKQEALRASRRMERVLQESQPLVELTAAKQLNAFLNNQSLVVLLTFKGRKLLFAGDAQGGNWERWLFQAGAPDKQASGALSPLAQQILSSLDFYKVGHHGSGNATPIAAAAAMGGAGRRFVAMCSTEAGVYGTEHPEDPTKGTEVPRGPLLDKLAAEGALVRSDQIAITVDGKRIDAAMPAALPAAPPRMRLAQGPLWVDCYL